MTTRSGFALGLMYGVGIGVFYRVLLDHLETAAHQVRRPSSSPSRKGTTRK